MTDSQSNVVWIGTVKGPFIFGCVCSLFSPFFLFLFFRFFMCGSGLYFQLQWVEVVNLSHRKRQNFK